MKTIDKGIVVMEIALKFIKSLKEEDLDKLINKKSKFVIKDCNKSTSKLLNDRKDFIDVIEVLKNTSNRNEAKSYLENLKFTNDKLLALGEQIGIKISKSNKKALIIDKIVEFIVGHKLKVEALRNSIIHDD